MVAMMMMVVVLRRRTRTMMVVVEVERDARPYRREAGSEAGPGGGTG
jgi:hypothetical protein